MKPEMVSSREIEPRKLMIPTLFSVWAIGFFCVKGDCFMLFSFAILFGAGLLLGKLCEKFKLPSLLGMLVAGILIGPYGLNALDKSVLDISAQLRKIALIVILIRAGLNLDLADLKRAGRPAILMCFVRNRRDDAARAARLSALAAGRRAGGLRFSGGVAGGHRAAHAQSHGIGPRRKTKHSANDFGGSQRRRHRRARPV